MTDVAVLLGADRDYAAEQLWNCIEFEKRIANVSRLGKILKAYFHRKVMLLLQIALCDNQNAFMLMHVTVDKLN